MSEPRPIDPADLTLPNTVPVDITWVLNDHDNTRGLADWQSEKKSEG